MQLKKEITLSYSVIPYSADSKADAFRSAYTFAGDFIAVSQTGLHGGDIAPDRSVINLRGDYIVFSALKKAENSNDAVLRIYNVSEYEQTADITVDTKLFSDAVLTNLAETKIEPAAMPNGSFSLKIPPKKIETILFKRKN